MPTTPYSPEELTEFKAILDAKLAEAESDLKLLNEVLSREEKDGTISKEETAQLISRQSKFIQHLHNALARIANRTYGICRVTGKPISKERLRLVPHATLSLEAKQASPASTPSTEQPAS